MDNLKIAKENLRLKKDSNKYYKYDNNKKIHEVDPLTIIHNGSSIGNLIEDNNKLNDFFNFIVLKLIEQQHDVKNLTINQLIKYIEKDTKFMSTDEMIEYKKRNRIKKIIGGKK